jgi:hypothetical protein
MRAVQRNLRLDAIASRPDRNQVGGSVERNGSRGLAAGALVTEKGEDAVETDSGTQFLGVRDGYAAFGVGSGTYTFQSRL